MLEHAQIQRDPFSHPRRSLGMIPLEIAKLMSCHVRPEAAGVTQVICLGVTHLVFPSIRVYQNAQRAPVDHKPRYESPKLCWCEDVDFEHGNWMWTNRPVPNAIDPKFRKLVPDTRPEFMGEPSLGFVLLEGYQPPRAQGNLVSEANICLMKARKTRW